MATKRKRKPSRVFIKSSMTGDRLQMLINILGLNQRTAASFLGFGERTVRRMIADEIGIDPRTAMLLELMAKTKTDPSEALAFLGIKALPPAEWSRIGVHSAPDFYGKRG